MIDFLWTELGACQSGFGSVKDGYPCNGRYCYPISTHLSTDDIIEIGLRAKGSSFRVLDIGTANGEFLINAHEKFGMSWQQILGISALDQRKQGSEIPDSSYIGGMWLAIKKTADKPTLRMPYKIEAKMGEHNRFEYLQALYQYDPQLLSKPPLKGSCKRKL